MVGTAQAVSGGTAQRQATRAQDQQHAAAYRQQQQTTPPPAAAAPGAPGVETNELIEQLTKLGQLHQAGVLTDAEFAGQKAKLLG